MTSLLNAQPLKQTWFVYLIQNQKGYLYTGITTNLERRFEEHKRGVKGAKFFRASAPKEIVFVALSENRSQASKLEAKIKKLKRADKLALIHSEENRVGQFKFS